MICKKLMLSLSGCVATSFSKTGDSSSLRRKYKPNNPRNKPSKNGILQPNYAICSSVKKNVSKAIIIEAAM